MNNYRVLSCPDSAVVCDCEAIQMKVSFDSHNEIGKKVIVIVGDLQKTPSIAFDPSVTIAEHVSIPPCVSTQSRTASKMLDPFVVP
jgi:hypothetical protein